MHVIKFEISHAKFECIIASSAWQNAYQKDPFIVNIQKMSKNISRLCLIRLTNFSNLQQPAILFGQVEHMYPKYVNRKNFKLFHRIHKQILFGCLERESSWCTEIVKPRYVFFTYIVTYSVLSERYFVETFYFR